MSRGDFGVQLQVAAELIAFCALLEVIQDLRLTHHSRDQFAFRSNE